MVGGGLGLLGALDGPVDPAPMDNDRRLAARRDFLSKLPQQYWRWADAAMAPVFSVSMRCAGVLGNASRSSTSSSRVDWSISVQGGLDSEEDVWWL